MKSRFRDNGWILFFHGYLHSSSGRKLSCVSSCVASIWTFGCETDNLAFGNLKDTFLDHNVSDVCLWKSQQWLLFWSFWRNKTFSPPIILMDYSITNVRVFGPKGQQIETQQQWPVGRPTSSKWWTYRVSDPEYSGHKSELNVLADPFISLAGSPLALTCAAQHEETLERAGHVNAPRCMIRACSTSSKQTSCP